MRDAYHEDLDAITQRLVELTSLTGSAMGRATTALLDADLAIAEAVIAGDVVIDAVYHDTEELAFTLLARQQPVAGDLRILVTSLRMVADLERSGDLALHVAKIARRRYPNSAVPQQLRSTILEMGQVAQLIMSKAGDCIANRDVALAAELETDDDAMDELHRTLFTALLDDEWTDSVECAVDITLAGRYYERFADHAVSLARRVVYLVTGERVHSS
ncbi:MAG TPA: phosphate signaling complex protein PhoU [Mycobacteriales bacterium]|nr:phosphate signaling complex protein PhoU [Mycobacteriales bacterium]